jgi:hypothetical protein
MCILLFHDHIKLLQALTVFPLSLEVGRYNMHHPVLLFYTCYALLHRRMYVLPVLYMIIVLFFVFGCADSVIGFL